MDDLTAGFEGGRNQPDFVIDILKKKVALQPNSVGRN